MRVLQRRLDAGPMILCNRKTNGRDYTRDKSLAPDRCVNRPLQQIRDDPE